MKKIKLKKRKNKLHFKRKIVLTSTLVLLFVIGIGYSALSVNLGIFGNITVKKHYGNTLYEVLEKEANIGTYAKEYTGEHHDSFTEEPSKKIYHWYAPSGTSGNELANQILDKNNVLFAEHCWQMIRTTDTGGVKMIYNGEAENNQCLDTRGTHVGYAPRTTESMSTTYYYGTSYTYDKTNNAFSLDGTITTGTIKEGQYTCRKTTSTGTCSTLYFVDKVFDGTTYYVLPLNGNSNYSQFGTLQFNQSHNSLSYVGYMYNTSYPIFQITQYYISITYDNLNTNWYYSDTIDYGNIVANQYTLTNPQLISNLSDYGELIGKYVLSNGGNTSNTEVNYIVGINESLIYYKTLRNGDLNLIINVGDSYTDNGNGTYTINNPTEITYIDWYNGLRLGVEDKYICDGASATCSNLIHIFYCTNSFCYKWETNTKYKYGQNVSYSNGLYTLTGDIVEEWDFALEEVQDSLSTHHYTCLSNSTSCSNINYVFYIPPNPLMYSYIQLSGELGISEAIDNMLYSDNVNTNDSVIKKGIDEWYKRYMISYTIYLEDTVFCNDRSLSDLGGFNPLGGSIEDNPVFNAKSSNANLSCSNITDKFTISNAKAKLTYPVSLLSWRESNILGNNNVRKTGEEYWLLSPNDLRGDYVFVTRVKNDGSLYELLVSNSIGMRPVISLKPGIEYTHGDGSMANPYRLNDDF